MTSVLFKSRGAETYAEIVGYKKHSGGRGRRRSLDTFNAELNFKMGDEKITTFTQTVFLNKPEQGKTVKIKFDPQNPENAEIKNFGSYFYPFRLFLIGAFFLILAAIMIYIHRPIPSREKAKQTKCQKDYKEYYEKAQTGDDLAQCRLAVLYYKGECVETDYEKALDLMVKAGKNCASSPRYNRYLSADSVLRDFAKQDYERAFVWAAKAAEQGYGPALFYIGEIYSQKNDNEKALEFYLKAAEKCDRSSLFALKRTQDYRKALELYGDNCELERLLDYILNELAQIYMEKQDYEKAFKIYSKSALQNNALAQYNIGILYYNGTGVEKDLQKAFEWVSKAAAQDSQYEEIKNNIDKELNEWNRK
jgi:TPR repeat protein